MGHPAAASAQSPVARQPRRASRARSRSAQPRFGTSTRSGSDSVAGHAPRRSGGGRCRAGRGEGPGGRDDPVPPPRGPSSSSATGAAGGPGAGADRGGAGRSPGSESTTRSGEAVVRSGASGPAQRQAAHSASATTLAGGPSPDSLASGLSARPGVAATSSSTTQPPTRRPCSSMRTRVPTATASAHRSGTT